MAVARDKEKYSCSAPTDLMFGCRRAASFPFVGNNSLPVNSVLKVRSHSESEGLNRIFRPGLSSCKYEVRFTPQYLQEQLRNTLVEQDEGSDGGSAVDSSSSDESDTPCASPLHQSVEVLCKQIKKVSFADDCGQDLFSIRVMKEASDQPPHLSPTILRRWAGEDYGTTESKPAEPEWNITFSQPASQYIHFRETLEKEKVSLENVFVKADTNKLVGTVKVVNLSFAKKVFLRITTNNWKSYVDKLAIHQPSTSKIHDTFAFEIDLPRPNEKVDVIDFCVCYVENETEHWDSNDGNNYKIQKAHLTPSPCQVSASRRSSRSSIDLDDAYKQDYRNWSHFAAWKNLSTDGPYW